MAGNNSVRFLAHVLAMTKPVPALHSPAFKIETVHLPEEPTLLLDASREEFDEELMRNDICSPKEYGMKRKMK